MSLQNDKHLFAPTLRWPISIQHTRIEHDDGGGELEEVSVFACPLGISPTPLVLRSMVLPVIGLLNGQNSMEDIVTQSAPLGLEEGVVREVIRLLDQYLFLDNERYHRASSEVRRVYASLNERAPAFAGAIYPAGTTEAKKFFNEMLAAEGSVQPKGSNLALLIAPHIDYGRGGSCYGRIYPELVHAGADLCIMVGTAHQYSPHLFHLTKKHFRTPLGVARCDVDFISNVGELYGSERAFADELLHKGEHSLELQMPFLAHLNSTMDMAPILVGSFHEFIVAGREPREAPVYNDFVLALVESIRLYQKGGKRICFLAGVDMAHVGREFGDDWELTDEKTREVSDRDAEYLDLVSAQDVRGLFQHIVSDHDARRMCGFPSLYLILDVFERLGLSLRMKTSVYDQSVDLARGCCVTYSGMSFYTT